MFICIFVVFFASVFLFKTLNINKIGNTQIMYVSLRISRAIMFEIAAITGYRMRNFLSKEGRVGLKSLKPEGNL